jgi:hypothetical protein
VLGILLSAADHAQACSCAQVAPRRVLVPVDGTTRFPTDGVLRVLLFDGFPDGLAKGLAVEYRLLDPRGTPVPLASTLEANLLTLRPQAPLAPETRYTVQRVFAYNARGELMDDLERSESRGDQQGRQLTRVWADDSSFTTGPGADRRQLRPPAVMSLNVHLSAGTSCGPSWGLSVQAERGADFLPNDIVGLEVEDMGVVHWERASASAIGVSRSRCASDPVDVGIRESYRVRLVARTAAEDVANSPWTLSSTTAIPPGLGLSKPQEVRSGTGADTQDAAFFRPEASALDQVKPVVGFAACPHGLSHVKAITLPRVQLRALRDNGPWLGLHQGKAYLVALGAQAQLLQVDLESGTTRTLAEVPSYSVSAWFNPEQVLLALPNVKTPGASSRLVFMALDYQGRRLWEIDVPMNSYAMEVQVVASSKVAALTWSESGVLHGVEVNPRSGKVLRATHRLTASELGAWHLATLLPSRRGVVAAGARAVKRPTGILVGLPGGGPNQTSRPSLPPPDWVAPGLKQTVALWQSPADRSVIARFLGARSKLDSPLPDGRRVLEGWPTHFSAAMMGDLLVMATQGERVGTTRVVVVDDSGRRSPPLRIDASGRHGAVAVAATESTVVAVYSALDGEEISARMEVLACVRERKAGAPTMIEPP